MLEAPKIIAFGVVCAIIYGILHDQVTAHVAVEYFTVAHPLVFPTESPFWLAVGWGIIATWWVGLSLGLLLALIARVGPWPKQGFADLRKPILMLMAVSGISAILAGLLGFALTALSGPWTIGSWDEVITPERQARFAFAAWAHSASYLVGALGGVLLAVRTLLKRQELAQAASTSSTYSG